MAYRQSWHYHDDIFWPVFGGPKESWWIGHSFCISLPKYCWYQINGFFLKAIYRSGQFKLYEGETINDNWRHVWRQAIGREQA
jgi:hypothetical protein